MIYFYERLFDNYDKNVTIAHRSCLHFANAKENKITESASKRASTVNFRPKFVLDGTTVFVDESRKTIVRDCVRATVAMPIADA